MNQERATTALRYAVIGYCVLFACTLAISFTVPLPQSADEIVESAPSEFIFALASFGILGALVGVVVGSLAILAHQRWGLWVHLIFNLTGVIAGFGLAGVLVSASASTLDDFLMILSGVIYGIGFSTNALKSGAKKT